MLDRIEMVVTEVTEYGSLRCVAGYDYENDRLVRPEPGPAQFWPAIYCGERSTFHPGHLVHFDGEKPGTTLPHRTEDWVVRTDSLKSYGAVPNDVFRDVCSVLLAKGPTEVYGTHLEFRNESAFVDEGVQCGSLCGIELPVSQFQLFEKRNQKGELRLRAGFGLQGHALDLSVAAKDFRRTHRFNGLHAAKNLIGDAVTVHLRLGLARAMQDGRCYLQVNGIYQTDGIRDV